MAASSMRMPTRDCAAISFRAVARPPRVGSRRQRIARLTESIAATRVCSGAESLSMGQSNSKPSRRARTAMPCSPSEPLKRTRSPGRARSAESSTPAGTTPRPVVLMKSPSPLPFSTTLVSPVTISTPTAAAASCIERTTRSSVASGRPSSRMKAALKQSGRAPPMARSFTVPWTASEPMSPPGKNSGWTTKESVVKASRRPSRLMTAWSSRRASAGLWKAGRKSLRTSSAVSRPPLPWPSSTVFFAGSSTGQVSGSSPGRLSFMAPPLPPGRGTPVLVVGRAGALGGNHGRAQGILRRAAVAEGRAVERLLQALQDLGALAFGRLFDAGVGEAEDSFSVEGGELRPQPQPAPGNPPQAAPLAVADFEDFFHDLLGGAVAFAGHGADVLVFGFGAALFELLDEHGDGFEQVERLEAPHDDGHAKVAAQGLVLPVAHHRADVPGGDEALHAVHGRAEQQAHRPPHPHVGDEQRKILQAFPPRLPGGPGVGGGGGLQPDGGKNQPPPPPPPAALTGKRSVSEPGTRSMSP